MANVDEKYFKGKVPAWNELMEHGDYDDYWQSRNPLQHLTTLDVPLNRVEGFGGSSSRITRRISSNPALRSFFGSKGGLPVRSS